MHDIGVTRILSPPLGGVPAGDYDWIVRVQNLGNFAETGTVSGIIYDTASMVPIFTEYHTLSDFPAGADTALCFNTTITVPNYYYCAVEAVFGDDNPANDTMSVNSFVPQQLGQRIYWINAQEPTSSMVLHGVEFDGEYFYLTGITAINEGKVFVLDTLGDLVWTIDQPGHCTGWGWRDMAFDRIYVGPDRIDTLYASCTAMIDKFGVDKTAGTLIYHGSFPGPVSCNRSLAYMPESLYFFTADLLHIYKFMKNGPVVHQDTTPWIMRGAAYDDDTLGGGSLWWSSEDSAAHIKEYDPNATCFTGRSFGGEYPTAGLGFAQGFRDMDVLFAVVNAPQGDEVHGYFLRWSDSTGIGEQTRPARPLGFGILPIHPNPIQSGNEIWYCAPDDGLARVNIYDRTGRLLTSLTGRGDAKTMNRFSWPTRDRNGQAIPSGVYFIKLDSAGKSLIAKIVYLE